MIQWILLVFIISLVVVEAARTPLPKSCERPGKSIGRLQCRPKWGTRQDKCLDLVHRCYCQHGIQMQWIAGGGCGATVDDPPVGCQCGNYCDIPCKTKCLKYGCNWVNDKCENADGNSGPVNPCLATPSMAPTTGAPTTQPSFGPLETPTFWPTTSPTVQGEEEITPTTAPVDDVEEEYEGQLRLLRRLVTEHF